MPQNASVPKKPPLQLVLSGPAKRDIRSIIQWSLRKFGESAALRYEALMLQAFQDLAANPMRPGSKDRPELLVSEARTYHLYFSRGRVFGAKVKEPRHFILYRKATPLSIEIGRILHDSRDLAKHLPDHYKSVE